MSTLPSLTQDGVGSGGVGGADDRAGVARVADVGEDADEPRAGGEHRVEVGDGDRQTASRPCGVCASAIAASTSPVT